MEAADFRIGARVCGNSSSKAALAKDFALEGLLVLLSLLAWAGVDCCGAEEPLFGLSLHLLSWEAVNGESIHPPKPAALFPPSSLSLSLSLSLAFSQSEEESKMRISDGRTDARGRRELLRRAICKFPSISYLAALAWVYIPAAEGAVEKLEAGSLLSLSLTKMERK